MKGLRALSDEIGKIYDSDSDDIANIINSLLGKSSRYYRIASYFTSRSFVSLAEGLEVFIKNKRKMKLIINYELEEEDYEVLKKSTIELENKFKIDLENIKSEIELNSAKVLGWMINENLLEIRVVIGNVNKLMHIKEGVFQDDYGDKVAFTGSANETYSAYERNIEQVTFFKSWISGQEDYVEGLFSKFNRFWDDQGNDARAYNLAKAIEKNLIRIRPKSETDLINLLNKLSKARKKTNVVLTPRPYQKEAMDSWINNKYRGIIELPTGCGKTKTALFCQRELRSKGPGITVIFSPTKTVSGQWVSEFENDDCDVIRIFDNPKWKNDLKKGINDMRLKIKEQLILVGTYALINSDFLIEQINSVKGVNKFIIADEVHSAGADKTSGGLLESYNMRLGLSATPKRWLDDEGTDKIVNYFAGVVFDKITLFDAIYKLRVLCEYDYHLIHVYLNEEELSEYLSLSRKIMMFLSEKRKNKDPKIDIQIQRISEKRANIVKNCSAKIFEFEKIVDKLKEEKSIVFVSPEQRMNVLDLLRAKVKYHQFTYSETEPELRKEILDNFKSGKINCIVAIKCLNEGLDIPAAKIGVLLASSANPREFIQRRGRLLRKDSSKSHAEIYDFFVTPPKEAIASSDSLKGQVAKELERIKDFAVSSRNERELSKELKTLKEKLGL